MRFKTGLITIFRRRAQMNAKFVAQVRGIFLQLLARLRKIADSFPQFFRAITDAFLAEIVRVRIRWIDPCVQANRNRSGRNRGAAIAVASEQFRLRFQRVANGSFATRRGRQKRFPINGNEGKVPARLPEFLRAAGETEQLPRSLDQLRRAVQRSHCSRLFRFHRGDSGPRIAHGRSRGA